MTKLIAINIARGDVLEDAHVADQIDYAVLSNALINALPTGMTSLNVDALKKNPVFSTSTDYNYPLIALIVADEEDLFSTIEAVLTDITQQFPLVHFFLTEFDVYAFPRETAMSYIRNGGVIPQNVSLVIPAMRKTLDNIYGCVESSPFQLPGV